MPNTYTQIHIQTVFAVKYREALIAPEWKDELYKFITGIIQNHGHKLLQINGMPDHVHVFFGMRPTQALSNLMQQVKEDSSKWIKSKGFYDTGFSGKKDSAGFPTAGRMFRRCAPILKTRKNTIEKDILEEYEEILKAFEVEYDPAYIFEPLI